jgi:hypothetical protein
MPSENRDVFPYTDLESKDWLNPLAILELRKAVRRRKDTVNLNDKVYSIRYEELKVFVKNISDFAPCGWFTYQQLEEYEFEADHDKHL